MIPPLAILNSVKITTKTKPAARFDQAMLFVFRILQFQFKIQKSIRYIKRFISRKKPPFIQYPNGLLFTLLSIINVSLINSLVIFLRKIRDHCTRLSFTIV